MHLDTNITLTDIATVILAFATTISLIYISRQVRVTRQQTKGEFLLALDEQFEKTMGMTMRLVEEPNFTPVEKDWIDLFRLMSVFERINIMVDDKMLGIDLVDRLFGFRLIYLVENDAVYTRLQGSGADWQDFIDLCYALADYRMRTSGTDRDRAFNDRVHHLSKQTHTLGNPFSTHPRTS